ncbi:type III endosome membrane protein TEMP-like [Astyanax mexicanus]|uniref:Type III endosome membrane protein TEMP-like n=1 Tax=Astyanax mexicanus TaxID=7994 RepID=A0A8T2LND4_ASTMX|nr:type III endosome membrane protein TEMP-like [Astyanax mexicanus]
MQGESMLGRLQRKLLVEDGENSKDDFNASNPRMMEENVAGSSPWPILVGLLLSVLSVAFVIMLVVRYRIIQRFFGGYSEALLPEGDTASQFSHAGTLAAHGMREREVYTIDHEEDDDGFIEDNYISSGEKQKVATDTEEEVLDTDSDDDLDIHFSIE